MASILRLVAAAAALVTASGNVDCSQQIGSSNTNEWIVGANAKAWMDNNPGQGTYVLSDNASDPVDIKIGCEVNYFLIWEDIVHVRARKEGIHTQLDVAWVQELQSGETAEVTSPRWYFVWESHLAAYQARGGPNPNEWDDYIAPSTLAGDYHWPIDTTLEHHEEARCDFYHQIFDADWKWHYFHWFPSWFPESDCYEYMGPEHAGDTGGLITTLWTGRDDQQHSRFGALTQYKGQMMWQETTNLGGAMSTDQYNGLKQFYMDTCAGRRDGAAWNQPWVTDWTWSWHVQNVHRDADNAPYCSWLKASGWNNTYWESPAIVGKYVCFLIDGITCDEEGLISSIILLELGLKGSAKALLDVAGGHTSRFYVSFNMLSGTLPPSMATNANLWDMDVWKNNFRGDLPCLTSETITHLDISYNGFEHFPECFYTEDRSILYMEHNSFRGTIHPDVGKLRNAEVVWMSYNLLTGTIPEEMCNMSNVRSLDIGGNRLEGSFPTACLNNPTLTYGWAKLNSFNAHHNRFFGNLPTISAAGRFNPHDPVGYWENRGGQTCLCGLQCGYTSEDFDYYWYFFYYNYYVAWWEPPYCEIGLFDFDHNFFGGSSGGALAEWDAVIELSSSVSGWLVLRAEGNRLAGALPAKLENWAFYPANSHYTFAFYLEDNLYRCEKDGRWPDWTLRYGVANLGQCLPIAHPESVSPSEATLGQAGQFSVSGRDFVARGQQRCKYISVSGGGEQIVAATRVTDNLVRCLIPVDMEEGSYRITVSNNDDEWASSSLLDGFVLGSDLTVSIAKPVVPVDANSLDVTMVLTGVDAETFDSGNFISGIASLLDVSPGAVLLGTDRRLRRLQSGYTVHFKLITDDATQSVDEIATTLEDGDSVRTKLVGAGMTTVTGVSTTVDFTKIETVVESNTESELPILWIVIGGVGLIVSCCFCAFIVKIYRMEKAGQSYFKEELNDEAGGPNNNGQVIGKPGNEESNNV
mmetsp:Transcript_54922/g.128414  ORF Transcript_54922/g.128414 Transcript_54922/m.128414 type:complete len:978 (+) Transcript_54922:47-2980(+)